MYQQTKGVEPSMAALFPEPEFAVQLREELSAQDVRHVLGLFGGDLQRLTAAIRVAADTNDTMALRRTAHALAGAAGAVGAMELERICRSAMAALKHDDTSLLAHCIAIEAAASSAELALERVRAEMPPTSMALPGRA